MFGRILARIQMQPVQKTVYDRRHQNAGNHQKDNSGEERIERGEELSGIGVEFIHRSHAAQDHGSVQERVQPGQTFQNMVAQYADGQRGQDKREPPKPVPEEPPEIMPARQQRLRSVLITEMSLGEAQLVSPLAFRASFTNSQ